MMKKISLMIVLTGLISCGSQTLPPRVINNYCDIHKPITTTRYDTCATILKADEEFCKYNKLCNGYSKKSECESPKKYTPLTAGEIELACRVKMIDNTKE